MKSKKVFLLVGLALAVLLAGAASYYLWVVPDDYTLQGRVINEKDEGVEGITLMSGDHKVTTESSGDYTLADLKKGDVVEVEVPEDYEKPDIDVEYDSADKVGLKRYTITKDIKLNQSLLGFVRETKTNEKYARHNLIWEYLDEPSKQVYSDAGTYEWFFKEARRLLGEDKGLSDFEIDKKNITVRETWTSPQGVEYQNVYEVPMHETLNDGTTRSSVSYVFKMDGKWKTTTLLTKEEYEKFKKALEELKSSE